MLVAEPAVGPRLSEKLEGTVFREIQWAFLCPPKAFIDVKLQYLDAQPGNLFEHTVNSIHTVTEYLLELLDSTGANFRMLSVRCNCGLIIDHLSGIQKAYLPR